MLGLKWRSLLLAGAVAFTAAAFASSSADAAWGYRYGYAYRPAVVPVAVYRPSYVAPRFVAPVRRAYRPVVVAPVAPVVVSPYAARYRSYPSYSAGYGSYSSGYRGYGVSVNFGVAPVGYIGY
ncbi:hypothetical protein [Aporhodopirellula aestuarii]|uniref:Uncharacterized protein n=1 Tax=Aporhodopirellula aestuarii TaxID=2950107 RepID=A0ABT0U0K3_9BACT|nr:hypothetical protein [Aporhodopirellula aestuarii]MCM2370370.1 hypothetical protein [Aporhodopirellula aestuarii]